MRFSGRNEDKLDIIYESMLTEKFIDVDDMISIIYSKPGSKGRGLGGLIADMIFVKKGSKKPTYNAKEITSRLMKAGLTKNEVGEVRTIFSEAVGTAKERVFKTSDVDEENWVKSSSDSFAGYIFDTFFNEKYADDIFEIAEKLVRMKLKNYLAKRK